MIVIRTARLFDGTVLHRDRAVMVEDGRVAAVLPGDGAPARPDDHVVAEGSILAPGFVDLQVNGGGGVQFNHAPSVAALRGIAAAHGRAGTTALLPTLISGTRAQIRAAIDAVRQAMAAPVPGIIGLHLEGPFISPQRRGIHPADAVTTMTEADLLLLDGPTPGSRLVTLAPERVPACHIARLVAGGATVFAGHSEATYEQALDGLAAGVSGFTHLFNAMSGLSARAPGVIGAALDCSGAFAGIIADGHHVHAAALRVAFAAKGPEALFLVSDAMATAASEATAFEFNGEPIRCEAGRLVNAAGTLAGAHLTLAEAVRHAVRQVGIPRDAALRMATATPAAAIRAGNLGRIVPGGVADLVVLDADLVVTAVWQAGRRLC